MKDIPEVLLWSLVVVVFLFLLLTGVLSTGMGVEEESWIKAAIERGYGQYCPKDGAFAWKGECVE